MNIKQQELSFQSITEATPVALILVDNKGEIIFLNPFTESLLEYSRWEHNGKKLRNLIPSIEAIRPEGFWEDFFANPGQLILGEKGELTTLTKTGKQIPVELRLNPVITEKQTCTLLSITDITGRIKSNEQFRLVVESAPNAMILTDSRGKIILVNKQTEILFGYERDELLSKEIEILVPGRMKGHHPGHRKDFYDHPKVRPIGAGRDLYGVRKDGVEIPVEIGLNPVEKDGAFFVLASVIDITERKKNEEALQLYARQIEEKNRELEEFTHIASHDLREPLNSIIGFTDLLVIKKSSQLDEEGNKMLGYIQKSANRMAEMISGLLNYASIGNYKELTLTDLNELVQTVLIDLDSSISKTSANIYVEPLPKIQAYDMQMRLLFQNLISNALKFTKEGTVPQITISAEKLNKGWNFAVKDNGIGIPENQRIKIFKLFHRLHGRNQYDGTGIGLAHCRKIVELHNGKIWVESELDKGSKFCFFIPSKLPKI